MVRSDSVECCVSAVDGSDVVRRTGGVRVSEFTSRHSTGERLATGFANNVNSAILKSDRGGKRNTLADQRWVQRRRDAGRCARLANRLHGSAARAWVEVAVAVVVRRNAVRRARRAK